MADPPRISEAEWEVMSVVWEHHPVTAQDVFERLGNSRGWSLRTVKTLLGRLVKKGALGFEVEGKRYRYHARAQRAECVAAESRSFLGRVLGGSASPLLATFVREGKLTAGEVAELRALLDEIEESQS